MASSPQSQIDYNNKIILAPMVRCTTLAFRLLALEYGADIVYCEEIIDFKLVNCKRVVNEITKTIDFMMDGYDKPVFQTNEKERGKVVFQLGTCNPDRALEVCKKVENDVAAIDINMGCPKEFSVQGGMGAALLKKPDLVKELLTKLVNGLKVPITCKIRCLKTLEETIKFCKMVQSCGVKAIAVHGRFQEERSRAPNHNDFIREIAKELDIPVIANGGSNEIKCYEDILKFKENTGAAAVMVARAAMWNCSVFRKEGVLDIDDVIKRFLEISLETNNFFYSSKYVLQQTLHEELQTERGIAVLASQSNEEIYGLFDMLEKYKENAKRFENSTGYAPSRSDEQSERENEEHLKKKIKLDQDGDETVDEQNRKIICMHAKFKKKEFSPHATPKSIVHTYTLTHDIPRPIYETKEKNPERVFKSVLFLNGVGYTTPYWEANKQLTEQAAAMVCMKVMNITQPPK